jgi:hypothetical protein
MTVEIKDRTDLEARLDALFETSYDDLRTLWRKLYRSSPPPKLSRDLLTLAIAWKLQTQAQGGLDAVSRRKLKALAGIMAEKGDLTQARLAQPKPGARLMRVWRGETHHVLVREDGFEWQGERYASLSVIARTITGTRWSGPRFFGLSKPVRTPAADMEVRADG